MASSDDVHKDLPVKLTEAELAKYGEQMGNSEAAIEKYELERKRLGDAMKAEKDTRRRIGLMLDGGTEQRKVLCRWVESIEENCKRLVRQDTGDIVDVLALTADDRQMSLESPVPPGDPDETIDLDDVPDDDEDDEDLDDEDEQAAPAAAARFS